MAITVGGLHTPHRDFGEDEPETPRDNPKGNIPTNVQLERSKCQSQPTPS